MATAVLRQRRGSQPQQVPRIDRSNPLTAGLRLGITPHGIPTRDLTGRWTLATDSSVLRQVVKQPGFTFPGSVATQLVADVNATAGLTQGTIAILLATTVSAYTYVAMAANHGPAGSYGGYTFAFYNDGGMLFQAKDAGGYTVLNVGTVGTNINDGNLHVAAVDFSMALATPSHVFLDGVQLAVAQNNFNTWGVSNGSATYFAGAEDSYWLPYSGSMYLVLVWDRQLSAAEHLSLYQNPYQIFVGARALIPPPLAASPSTASASGVSTVSGVSSAIYPPSTGASARRILLPQRSQPQRVPQIDWSDPLTAGLDVVFVPAARGRNLANPGFSLVTYPGAIQRAGSGGKGMVSATDSGNSTTYQHVEVPPILGAQDFTLLTGVLFKDFLGTTFGDTPTANGGVLYSQRYGGGDYSPTLCASTMTFAGSGGVPHFFWGFDSSGAAIGVNNGSTLVVDQRYTVGARSYADTAKADYNGLSLFVDGVNVSQTPSSTAGIFTNAWTGPAAYLMGYSPQWPAPAFGILDVASMEFDFFFRWRRALSDREMLEISRNPWQIFKGTPRMIADAPPAALGWIADISHSGWLTTGTDHASVIDELSANDADFITSPILQGTMVPEIFALTAPMAAGAWTFQVRAKTTAHGTLRIRFLDAGNASVGVSADQSLTTSLVTYSLGATLSGTATQIKIEVSNA